MAGAYTLNAYQVNFASVLTIQDANLVNMFKAIEKSGLIQFLESPAIIYKTTLLDFYAKATIEDGKIVYSQGDASITIDAALLESTFFLSFSGNSECFVITREEMSIAFTNFSASGEELSPSYFKKLQNGVPKLVDIVAKAILVKTGTFDKLTKEKVQVMIAITSEAKVDLSKFLFKIMKDKILRRGTGRVDDLLNQFQVSDPKKGESDSRTGGSVEDNITHVESSFRNQDPQNEEAIFKDIGTK